jgi:uncharacterized membrane protein
MFIKLYLIALPIFVILDMTWLGLIANNFYRQQIGALFKPDVNWFAAAIFYLLFLAGLVVFVIEPAMDKKAWSAALFRGAFFGVVTYATYDLTNLAVTKDWPVLISIVDMAWGTILAASVATLTYVIARKTG